jgi:hypothetical protein
LEPRVVPAAQRLTREELIAVTNSYFDGITAHDGTAIMAHPGCSRLENGQTVSGDPALRPGSPAPDPASRAATSACNSGLKNFSVINVVARRYPLVDTEAQTVLAFAVFIRKPGVTSRRNAFAEWFSIDNQKIRHVYSAMYYPANDLPVPNWEPYEPNFPLPVELANTPNAGPARPAQ